jgi:CheY-like chemotaxis protein
MNAIPLPPLCVLVVDDWEDAADSLAMLVRAWGHRAQVAYGGVEALRLAARCRPDVVLLDIGLPGLSGWDVAPLIWQLNGLKHVFIVAVSGSDLETDRERSHQAGCDLHILKPIPLDDLQRLLIARQEEKQRHDPRATDPPADRAWDGGGRR